jgi:hypothetical protein
VQVLNDPRPIITRKNVRVTMIAVNILTATPIKSVRAKPVTMLAPV